MAIKIVNSYTSQIKLISSLKGGPTTIQSGWLGDITQVFEPFNVYTLTLNLATTNISVTCTRTSSPKADASTGTLSSGALIYTGDVLQITTTTSGSYYVYEATSVTQSYTETVTVSGNVTRTYHAVLRNSLTINTTSASFSTEGQYPWSQSFTVASGYIKTSGNVYYPTVTALGSASTHLSLGTTSIGANGYATTAKARIRGSIIYYTWAPEISLNAPYIDETYMEDDYDLILGAVYNGNSVACDVYFYGTFENSDGEVEESDWVYSGITLQPYEDRDIYVGADLFDADTQAEFVSTYGYIRFYFYDSTKSEGLTSGGAHFEYEV